MIDIVRSQNGDSRTKDSQFGKETLRSDTESHISDVRKGIEFICQLLTEAGQQHDHTKLDHFDDFFAALTSDKVKESQWYRMHTTTERHHLKTHVPNDVTLIDVIEHVVDCTMAGLARSGQVYDIDIDPAVLMLAVQNTSKMLIENTNVSVGYVDGDGDEDILNSPADDEKGE